MSRNTCNSNKMRKVIVFLVLILSAIFYTQAQVEPHAIGIRFGGNGDINGGEFSYQHGLGNHNRFEFDLGFSGNKTDDNMFLAGIYHWDMNISNGLNWFIGPGAVLGFHSTKVYDDYYSIGLGGQIGIEYNFNNQAPFLISIDARPMWDFVGSDRGFGWGASLGLRYTW